MPKTKMRMKLYSTLNTLPPVFTSSPRRFYTKRTPSWAYLRRTRKVFTRGNAVCNIRSDIKRAQSTPSRTHTLSLSIGPQKINRSEPFLQIQIAGRGGRGREKQGPRRLVPRDILFLAPLCSTFENFSNEPYKIQLATDRRSAVKTRNSIPVIEREKVSPTRAIDLYSVNFLARRATEGDDKGIKRFNIREICR